LGVIIYEMIDGNPPFWDEDDELMVNNILDMELCFSNNFSDDCADFISQLLSRNPKKRMGYGIEGLIKIKRHPWFEGLDWVKVYKKEIDPLFKPHINNDIDASNFETEFTEQEPQLSYDDSREFMSNVDDFFKGFSYQAPTEEWLQYREREKTSHRKKRKVSRVPTNGRDSNVNNSDDIFQLEI